MKLHSPKFEQTLRQRVKQTVRNSPELKREFRRANQYQHANRLNWIVRPLFTVFVGYMVWAATVTTERLATGLALINLWLLWSLCWHINALRARFYQSNDLGALTLLPIAREKMFRWQLQKYFRQSLLSLLDLLAGFGALAYYCDFSPAKWAVAFLLAVLTWVTLLAMSGLCAARLPRTPFHFISTGLMLAGLVIFFAGKSHWPLVLKAVNDAAPVVNLLLPTGWPVSLFHLLTDQPQWSVLIFLAPIAALIATAKDSLARLLADFQYREFLLPETFDLVPETEMGAADKQPTENPVRLGTTAITEIIRGRNFFHLPQWPERGWLEKYLWRWLDRREKILSEFVFPGGYVITAPWQKIFRNIAITIVAASVAGFAGLTLKFCILGLGLFVTICQAIVQLISHGRAFQLIQFSGGNIPMYVGYGVGFRELSRLLLKCSVVQIPLLLLFTTVTGTLSAWLAGFPAMSGAVFGLKSGCLLFASRFIFLTMAFSAGTNDTARLRFRVLLLVLLMISLGLGFAGLGGAGLFLPAPTKAWLFCLAAVADAYVFSRVYQWFYLTGRFDLMGAARK